MQRIWENSLTTSSNSVLKAIAAIALPAIVTNITTPLLALCDVAIMGHIADDGAAVYIASIAAGGTMFNMLYWLCGFLRMGTSGITAQASGACDDRHTAATLFRSLLVAITLALIIIAFRGPLASLFFAFIDAPERVSAMALRYFSIVIWGAPATLGLYALTGWLLGMRNTSIAMWVSIGVNIVNIILNVVLVFGFNLEIRGVAIATLFAQWLGFTVCGFCAWHRFRPQLPGWSSIIDKAALIRFFRVNVDIFIRTLCLVIVTLYFTRVGAMQGTVMLAVNTLLMQFFTIFSYFMDGLAFSAEALCGHYTGADDKAALNRTVKAIMQLASIIAIIFTLVYLGGSYSFLSLMSADRQVVAAAFEYIPWVVVIPFAGFMAFVFDGVFIGLTRTRALLLSMGVAMAVFFIVDAMTSSLGLNHALWLAFESYLLARGLVLAAIYRRIR